MPRLKQYVSQESTIGRGANVSRVRPQGVDLSGLVRGVQDFAVVRERALADLQQTQERERQKLEHDEAVMHVTNVMSEAAITWQERLQQKMQESPAAAAGFTESTLKDFDSWTNEKLKGAPHEGARKLLEQRLGQMKVGIHADAFKFEVGQRNKALLTDFQSGLDADRRAVIANPALFTETLARRTTTAEALNLPAEAKAKLVEGSREALAFDAAQGLVDIDARGFLERSGVRAAKGAKGRQGGRDQSADAKVAGDPLLSSLKPEQLRQVIDRASMIVSQQEAAAEAEAARRQALAEAAAARREREASQAFNILSAYALDGRKPDPSSPSIAMAMKKVEGTAYAAAYKELLADAPQRQAAAMQPVAVQEAELNALMVRRNVQGPSPELDKEIKRRETVLAASKKDYAEEPLDALVERGAWQATQPIDTSSVDTIRQGLPNRVEQAREASRKAGRPVSPLRSREASQLAAQLAALPPDQQAMRVSQLSDAMDSDQSQALARQINDKDRGLALAFALRGDRTTSGKLASEHLLRGRQVMAETHAAKIGEKGDRDRQALRADLIAEMDGRSPGMATITGKAREDIIDAATYIDAGLKAGGFNAGAKHALRLAIGGEMVELNGRRLPLPAGVELSAFRDRMGAYPIEALRQQAKDGQVVIGGRAVPVDQLARELPQATLAPAGRGRYFVNTGAGIATTTGGEPLIVTAQ